MSERGDKVSVFLEQCEISGIKNPVAFLKGKTPCLWGFTRGAFPRGIIPTDLDGFVECNSYFLILENKHVRQLENVDGLKVGQLNSFRRLNAATRGRVSVWMLGCDDNDHLRCMRRVNTRGKIGPLEKCDTDQLLALCAEWAKWAEEQPAFVAA